MNRSTRRKIIRDIRSASKSIATRGLRTDQQIAERRRIAKELSSVPDRA
jgi:hypothetical protein